MSAYGMSPMRRDHGDFAEQGPVSPLSIRSQAILARRNSTSQVSPLKSPELPYSISQRPQKSAENYTLPPKAYVMPARKPFGAKRPIDEEASPAQTAAIPSPPARESVQSRPRSQSLRPLSEILAMPTAFLQDFTNHADAEPTEDRVQSCLEAIPIGFLQDFTNYASTNTDQQQIQSIDQNTPAKRSRSQTLPSHPVTAELEAYKRRACTTCGNLQRNSRQDFIYCKKCTNVYYCTVECWDKRVCHSRPPSPEKKCIICGLRQSFQQDAFKDCGRCKDIGKSIYYCSDHCWTQRRCHLRASVYDVIGTPAQPTRTYHPGQRSQQQRKEPVHYPAVKSHGLQQRVTHFPNPIPGPLNLRRPDIRLPDPFQHHQESHVDDVEAGSQISWIDSKACAISIWIIVPLIIFITILGLVLGLKR